MSLVFSPDPRLRQLRRPGLMCLMLLLTTLTACGDKPAPVPPAEPVRPAHILTLNSSASTEKLRFPGRVRAGKRAELSFNVPGTLVEFELREGARVKAGQVIARIDAAVFAARVNAARAEFERANSDLERYQRLWDKAQAVARSEVDERRSRLEVARTNLAAAEQELADTTIRAPFAGVMTRRRLETYASVQARQAIADLQDLRTLEVVINVPERIYRSTRPQQTAIAVFAGQENRPLDLRLKSYATEADPQTQTYEVVLTLASVPPGMTLFPGMSATVMPPAAQAAGDPGAVWIPLGAVVGDGSNSDGGKFVWVVGPEGVVARRAVAVGEIRGADIRVQSGLADGERIVTVGVHALREGMKVRPLEAP